MYLWRQILHVSDRWILRSSDGGRYFVYVMEADIECIWWRHILLVSDVDGYLCIWPRQISYVSDSSRYLVNLKKAAVRVKGRYKVNATETETICIWWRQRLHISNIWGRHVGYWTRSGDIVLDLLWVSRISKYSVSTKIRCLDPKTLPYFSTADFDISQKQKPTFGLQKERWRISEE